MGCSTNTPPVDSNCADPAYRAAHPDECKNFAYLTLKPEYSLIEGGMTVQFHTFLFANGKEVELTLGLTYSTSNVGAAIIGPDGIATGVTAGTATISVQWQDLYGYAQIDVVGSCDDTHQHFAILIDDSKSMGQSFGGSYPTKLAFSKSVAADFCDTINYSKDDVSVWEFGDTGTRLIDFGTDAAAARAQIQSISLTTEKTNISDALSDVIAAFPSTGTRVIVMFTDGEWAGDDPHHVAQAFREGGGTLVIVVTRGWGDFYADMAEIASSGFLLSAYAATETDILPTLSGLKSFLCSGDCHPAPGLVPTPQLDYSGFLHWEVTRGCVDLIGLSKWDIWPGNGMYVDLSGSGECAFEMGQITSIDTFTFTSGKTYRFSIDAAGNGVHQAGTFKVRVRVGNELDQIIERSGHSIPFTTSSFDWTVASTHTGKIIIEQYERAGDGVPVRNVGTPIDNIVLTNVTNSIVLLSDDFNNENLLEILPSASYYGCLTSPPGVQSADPTPPTPRVTE